MPTRIEAAIDVYVSSTTAYEQWTRFEELPRFIRRLVEVRRVSEDRLRWYARVRGRTGSGEARIVERQSGRRISWTSSGHLPCRGTTSFQPLGEGKCRVTMQLEFRGEHMQGLDRTRVDNEHEVQDDLRSFANFVEAHRVFRRGG